jgi:hypothetical protein
MLITDTGGGRKAGAKVNRIHDMGADFEADVYVMGHTHERGWVPQKPMIGLHRSQNKATHRERIYGWTGSFMKTVMEGQMSYSEKAGYPPTSLGHIYLTFSPNKQFISTHVPGHRIK